MVTKIELWKTDDGKEFDSEIEALRHENELLRKELDALKTPHPYTQVKNIQNVWAQNGITGFYGYSPNSQMYPLPQLAEDGGIVTTHPLPSGFVPYDPNVVYSD